jgi:hypothetical protein
MPAGFHGVWPTFFFSFALGKITSLEQFAWAWMEFFFLFGLGYESHSLKPIFV